MILAVPAILAALSALDGPKNESEPVLPKGHVAYSLKFTPNEGINEFILPGTRIDVVLVENSTPKKTKSTSILKHVLVVAVDSLEQNGQKVATATLAVKPADAKVLEDARKKGKLTLMLRPPDKP